MVEAIISLAALGLLFGGLLGVAARYFLVEQDPRVARIEDLLPGANCAACGYPNCGSLAQALVQGEADVCACPVGGTAVAGEIAAVLGMEPVEQKSSGVKTVARVLCGAGRAEVQQVAAYEGLPDCAAASKLSAGGKACCFACLGFGNCARVCPVDAITMTPEGKPVVDEGRCIACGNCVEACPQKVMALLPAGSRIHVACHSPEPGKVVNKSCKVGCIACRVCERVCPVEAIKVDNNLAVVNYEVCTECGLCVEKCPRNTIVDHHLAPAGS